MGPIGADALEVDEAALRVRVNQAHAYAIADVEAFLSALDAPLDRRIEDADPRALRRRAGDDALELLPDAARQQQAAAAFRTSRSTFCAPSSLSVHAIASAPSSSCAYGIGRPASAACTSRCVMRSG